MAKIYSRLTCALSLYGLTTSAWSAPVITSVTTANIDDSGGFRDALDAVNTGGVNQSGNQITFAGSYSLNNSTSATKQNLPPINIGTGTLSINVSSPQSITMNDTNLTGTPPIRGLFIYSGNVTINAFTIQKLTAQGGAGGSGSTGGGGGAGAGGALFVGPNATVTLTDFILTGNMAKGGNGGNGAGTSFAGGGGGGLGGNGGSSPGGNIWRGWRRFFW